MIEKFALFHAEPLPFSNSGKLQKIAHPILKEVQDYMSALKPRAGSQYVLVNAMGASEYYGSNANGDWWPEKALKHAPHTWKGVPLVDIPLARTWPYGYPTFYQAKPFAHHKNSDPSRGFGEVELALWNEPMHRVELVLRVDEEKCTRFGGTEFWEALLRGEHPDVSMGARVPYDTCFPAGTLVRTSRGNVPIESVVPGDSVVSHTGVLRRVTSTMQRDVPSVVRVCASGLPSITATDNHPFLVLRRESVRACKGTANGQRVRHTFERGSSVCRRCGVSVSLEFVWAAADTLRPGDYLVVPVRTEEGAAPGAHRARLLGYYLGDGHIIQQRRGRDKKGELRTTGFAITVGAHEEEHLDRVLRTIESVQCANKGRVYSSGEGRNAFVVNVHDADTSAWLVDKGGRYSDGKRLADDVFTWPEEDKLELVAGYIDTDGSFDTASGQVRVASVNRGLLLDVQRLLLSIGVVATVCFGGASSGYAGGSPSWYLVLSGAQAARFVGRSVKVKDHETSTPSPQSFFYGEYWCTPIKGVSEIDGETTVHNLSVAVDESYIAEGRAVHNCSICLDHKRYAEALATFDPKKHKHPGEAVLEVHKKRPITGVSPTRATYCVHARTMMNKILPDGRKVYVSNDFPKFFDISFVKRGADRTAKVMLKIAQDTRTGLYLPEDYLGKSRVQVPTCLQKVASVDALDDISLVTHRDNGAALRDALLKHAFGKHARIGKRSEMDKQIPAEDVVPLMTKREGDIPKDVLNELGKHPLRDVAATTNALGIVLRPREFQRITIVAGGRPDLADNLDRQGICFGASGEEDMGDLHHGNILSALLPLLLPLLASRSAFSPAIERRITLVLAPEQGSKKQATSLSSPVLSKIAATYNGYRAMFSERLPTINEALTGTKLGQKVASTGDSNGSFVSHYTEQYARVAFLDECGRPGA